MIRVIGSGGPMAEVLLRRRSNRRAMMKLGTPADARRHELLGGADRRAAPYRRPYIDNPRDCHCVERGEHNLNDVPPKGPTQ
jgi:hypothetical protein